MNLLTIFHPKNISMYTKDNYKSDFTILQNFLAISDIKPELDTITTPTLRKYFAYLKEKKSIKSNNA